MEIFTTTVGDGWSHNIKAGNQVPGSGDWQLAYVLGNTRYVHLPE